jgi:hypothetical protein
MFGRAWRRAVRCGTTVALAVLVIVAVDASGASAHGDQGLLALEANAGRQSLTVEVRARLVYANDGDPVSTARVTVDALGPDGATVPAAAMASGGDGTYAAELRLPGAGAWTVRATATNPTANAEIRFDAVPATTTTTTPARQTTQDDPPASPDDGNGSGSAVLAAVIGLMVLLGVAVVVWQWRRRSATAAR